MFDLRAHPVPVPGKNALKLLFEEGFEGAEDEIRKGGGGRFLASSACPRQKSINFIKIL